MKFEIHISQRAIIENNFDLDLIDAAIMDFCRTFATSSACRKFMEDGRTYYWFSHKNLCEQMPLLKLKPDSAYRRMRVLAEKGFLTPYHRNKQENASWYGFGKLADLLVSTIGSKSEGSEINPKVVGKKSEPSDENPMPIGSKSEGPSDQNPMYKNIRDTKDKLKEKTSVGEPNDSPAKDSVFIEGIGEITIDNIALYVTNVGDKYRIAYLKENTGRKYPNVPEFARAIRAYQAEKNPPKPPMKIPALEEVQAYFREKGHPINEASLFWNHHETKGWKIKGVPMEKWKTAVSTWINSPYRNNGRTAPTMSAQDRRARNEINVT